jgi:alpha-tubulin suppressor-like RCC1 family protein/uncharacterized protein YjdB
MENKRKTKNYLVSVLVLSVVMMFCLQGCGGGTPDTAVTRSDYTGYVYSAGENSTKLVILQSSEAPQGYVPVKGAQIVSMDKPGEILTVTDSSGKFTLDLDSVGVTEGIKGGQKRLLALAPATGSRAASGGSASSALISANSSATDVIKVDIVPEDQKFNVGDVSQLNLKAQRPKNQSGFVPADEVDWKVDKPALASVSSTGVLTCLSDGDITITAKWNQFTASKKIKISPLKDMYNLGGWVFDNQGYPVSDVVVSLSEIGHSTVTASDGRFVFSRVPSGMNLTLQCHLNGVLRYVQTVKLNSNENQLRIVLNDDVHLVSVSITPDNVSIPKGTTQQFAATGHYSDNSTKNLTTQVTWASSNEGSATVSSSGVVTGVNLGTATITASYQDKAALAEVMVTNPVLTGISITPASYTSPLGLNFQFEATGTYSDGTTYSLTDVADWYSNNTGAVLVSEGFATTVGVGTADITASYGGFTSSPATYVVTAAELVSITVTPESYTLKVGGEQQYTAMGKYTDNSNIDISSLVSWDTSDPAVAVVSNEGETTGVVKAVGEGTANIIASFGTVFSSPVSITVEPAPGTSDNIAITCGDYFSLALKSDGTVWAWGANWYGQLGNGTASYEESTWYPVQVKGSEGNGFLENITAVAAANNHSLALDSEGNVWAWGANWYGQLGNGTTNDSYIPLKVKASNSSDDFLEDVIAIAAGSNCSLALKSDGTVWSWGYNETGKLGDGTVQNKSLPVQVKDSDGTGYLTNIIAISSGHIHSLALRNDGTVWAWGENWVGNLGDGTYNSRLTPVQVKGPTESGYLEKITAISSNFYHSLALREDGTVWGWGANWNGQLGDGSYMDSSIPVQVKGEENVGFLVNITSISTGFDHSVASSSEGFVWSWGYNGSAQLGNGSFANSTIPVKVKDPENFGFLEEIVTIFAGAEHSLALKEDGTIWSWGANWFGQLGIGWDDGWSTTPAQVKGPDGEGFLQLK